MACGAKRLVRLVCLGNPDPVDSQVPPEPNRTFPARQRQQCGRPAWLATAPEEDWPEELDRSEVREIWEEPWGDRRQELVIMGARIADDLLDQLEQCCPADAEMAVIQEAWLDLPEPFLAWQRTSEGDDETLEQPPPAARHRALQQGR